jgi:hypothetical protein
MNISAHDPLPFWVIYNSPVDLPGRFVARKWLLGQPENQPTPELLQGKTLEEVRGKLPKGLVRFPREVHDDPNIIESWV